MKKNRKKTMKLVIIFVTLTMVISTFAAIIKSSSSGNTTKVTEEKLNKEKGQTVETEITETAKKDMENAKVEVGENEVKAVINLNEGVNKIQADKIASEYAEKLKEQHKGKDVKVEVVEGEEKVSESNVYNKVESEQNKKDGMPEIESIQIKDGVTNMDRHVIVTLKTDTPEKYMVAVMGNVCRYVENKKYFHTVVDSNDESKIKKDIIIFLKKK
ncbi:hypothetical protein OW763_09280 [Clostridium aestuarii]|uniref:Uncharacterized protein n=1 Tax=Clostridium aestuarii TaxID=338193 RepID=A0ABT4CZX2_9CLOT|nr:hypothetical protein [Clostridium aestuarii]MCY6484531.1 hypothetical protein [Clostridium aestuarii]